MGINAKREVNKKFVWRQKEAKTYKRKNREYLLVPARHRSIDG